MEGRNPLVWFNRRRLVVRLVKVEIHSEASWGLS